MKRLALVLVVLVLAGAGAACDEIDSAAITVNGDETSQTTVDDYLREVRDNDTLAKIATEQGAELTVSSGTISSTVTAGILSYVVRGEIAQQELDRRDLEATDADRDTARQQASQVFGSEAAFDAFPESFQDDFIDWMAAVIVLQAEVPNEDDFRAVFSDADVDIDPRYGTWSAENLAIASPATPLTDVPT